MKEIIIKEQDGPGYYSIIIGEDVENVNPITHYSNFYINNMINTEREILFYKSPMLTALLGEEFFIKRATLEWEKMYKTIITTHVSENLISLLSSSSKREQERLLKGQKLTPTSLLSLLFIGFEQYGYTFSNYSTRLHHKGLDESALPSIIHIQDDGEVKKVGETTLTDGQLKNVIQHRKVVVTKFLDRGDEWHCFFVTYKSLSGKESWRNGQPHYHYISDKWGISREEALRQFKSERYPTTSVHIEFNDYGN